MALLTENEVRTILSALDDYEPDYYEVNLYDNIKQHIREKLKVVAPTE